MIQWEYNDNTDIVLPIILDILLIRNSIKWYQMITNLCVIFSKWKHVLKTNLLMWRICNMFTCFCTWLQRHTWNVYYPPWVKFVFYVIQFLRELSKPLKSLSRAIVTLCDAESQGQTPLNLIPGDDSWHETPSSRLQGPML
jgi:hypothetical protein